MSKEPGQMAREAWARQAHSYVHQHEWSAAECWAAVETTIRSDEAAKVRAATIEECAKAVVDRAVAFGRQECCGFGKGSPPECCCEPVYMISDREAERAIRAKGAEHGDESQRSTQDALASAVAAHLEINNSVLRSLSDRLADANAEIARLREALAFYASGESYAYKCVVRPCGCCSDSVRSIDDDEGSIARAALKGEPG